MPTCCLAHAHSCYQDLFDANKLGSSLKVGSLKHRTIDGSECGSQLLLDGAEEVDEEEDEDEADVVSENDHEEPLLMD